VKKDIIIIGGGPAGIICALTAKSVYPHKSVCLVKATGDGVIPCAIPYMIHSMADPEENRMGNMPLEKAGVEVMVDRVVVFDPAAQKVTLKCGKVLSYERLVLATGDKPVIPSIPGIEKGGVFTIKKSLSAMSDLCKEARKADNVVIMGGGFIGAEFADELAGNFNDARVRIVEMQPMIMSGAFDAEFCDRIAGELSRAGVVILNEKKVASIDGGDHVESVTLDDGKRIQADFVLIGIGGKPDTGLAEEAGLRTTDLGAIWVDSYMRTTAEKVFAVGDCALKRDFFTRREVPIRLASNATAEARIAGTNLYGIRVLRQIQGTIAAFSTKIGGIAFGSAGWTERVCAQEKFLTISATACAPDRHPESLKGASELKVKLIFADRTGILLGGQISGGASVGELINTIAVAVQKKMTARELDMMQVATHPLLTSAPTVHPLVNAAHLALGKLRSR